MNCSNFVWKALTAKKNSVVVGESYIAISLAVTFFILEFKSNHKKAKVTGWIYFLGY